MLFFYNVLPKRKQIQMNSAILRRRNHLPEKMENRAWAQWHTMGYWDPLHTSHLAPKFSNSQQNQKKTEKNQPVQPLMPNLESQPSGERLAEQLGSKTGQKMGKFAGKSLHDLSRANPTQHPWLSCTDCPRAVPSTGSTSPLALEDSARARAQGCPAAKVKQI